MEPRQIAIIVLVALGLALVGGLLFFLLAPRKYGNLRILMGSAGGHGLGTPSEERARLKNDPGGKEFERLKEATKRKGIKKRAQVDIGEKFFQAGMFSDREKAGFHRMRLIAPIVGGPVMAIAMQSFGAEYALIGGIVGVLIGLQLPYSLLNRKIARRSEDIMFYLPLVIEQIAIGVSSSLDIGPCLQRVVQMADERDSHNVVTELLRHAQFYIKSGVSLEDALMEVGRLSGHTELKHSFMSLSQVARHGGEITRQLQELADAVANQRETKIEAKIKKLELEATGPVALVFAGFLVILLIGFGIQLKGAFGG